MSEEKKTRVRSYAVEIGSAADKWSANQKNLTYSLKLVIQYIISRFGYDDFPTSMVNEAMNQLLKKDLKADDILKSATDDDIKKLSSLDKEESSDNSSSKNSDSTKEPEKTSNQAEKNSSDSSKFDGSKFLSNSW
ncbi:hypothetical protein [Limosilactobacillus mucosae]|uniref:hypothetical protein n=1 Tax=Limosilactobacillus mucosae TaxID=97478 RepID=UPI003995D56E